MRLTACSSTDLAIVGSVKMRWFAAVSVRPTAPVRRDSRNTGTEPSWKAANALPRRLALVAPVICTVSTPAVFRQRNMSSVTFAKEEKTTILLVGSSLISRCTVSTSMFIFDDAARLRSRNAASIACSRYSALNSPLALSCRCTDPASDNENDDDDEDEADVPDDDDDVDDDLPVGEGTLTSSLSVSSLPSSWYTSDDRLNSWRHRGHSTPAGDDGTEVMHPRQ
mmetsp:Transcript_14178/g.44646  ORF Transcript_14178/g.44646 Transcript_14178/m.44646 type:complete len:224 (+) Transcript_14178:1565-2236(+)